MPKVEVVFPGLGFPGSVVRSSSSIPLADIHEEETEYLSDPDGDNDASQNAVNVTRHVVATGDIIKTTTTPKEESSNSSWDDDELEKVFLMGQPLPLFSYFRLFEHNFYNK